LFDYLLKFKGNKMLRKNMCFVLVLLLGILLVACGSESNPVDGDVDQEVSNETDDTENSEVLDGDVEEDSLVDGDSDGDLIEAEDGDLADGDEDLIEEEEELEPLNCTATGSEPLHGVYSISGKVVDESANGLANAATIICVFQENDISACLNPVMTSEDGSFTTDIPESRRCMLHASIHVLMGASNRVSLFCPIDLSDTSFVETGDYRLPVAPEGTRDTLGDTKVAHEIKADDGTTLSVVPDNLSLWDYSYEDIRVMPWDANTYGWPCFIDAANPPEALVALTPEIEFGDGTASTAKNDAVHLSFVNSKNLAAGTMVNLWGLGGVSSKTNDGTKLEEGEWTIIGEAKVSDDGAMISTEADKGLPFFTWFGWTEK